MAALWATSLPAYLASAGGVTASGDPTGSLWYTVVCFAIAGLCLAAVYSTAARQDRKPGGNRSVSVAANNAGS